MHYACGLVALTFGAMTCLELAGAEGRAQDKKGAVVELDELKAAAPVEWKAEEPTSRMRYLQFRLPHTEGDKADAELVIFKGLGGTAAENVRRWKDQFRPPQGKSIDDVSKVAEIKIGGHPATYLDVSGTYLFKAKPIDKGEPRPDYRMLGIHFEGPKNNFHIKLVGPAKTVERYKVGFDEWLKALK